MSTAIHTSDPHKALRMWRDLGGTVGSFRGTGETRLDHPAFPDPLRINSRRKDVPRCVLDRINQLLRRAV